MSGKSWVGTTSVPKPEPGRTITESVSIVSALSDADTVRCFTTADGLSGWLDSVTKFDSRRGGTLKFEPGYAGSYSLINIPTHVVLATELHGEVDVRIQAKSSPILVDVTITRFVRESEDVESVRATLQRTLYEVQELLHA